MASNSNAGDIITPPSDSQPGTQATSSSPLFVKCPGNCERRVALDFIKLASDGRSRAVWTCSSCSQIKKKQIKIRWYNLVCVQCTRTHGKTRLIQSCARTCPAKQALERKKDLIRGSKHDPMSKQVVECPGTCKQRIAIESVNLGRNGRSKRKIWTCSSCSLITKKRMRISCIKLVCVRCTHTHGKTCLIGSCASDCPTKQALEAKSGGNLGRDSKPDRISKRVFKYENNIYQDVANFCDTYEGLKNTYSDARAQVMNTDFPKSTYLVVPGLSRNNYRHIPENWKNGARDLKDVEGAAYILGQKTRPTISHLLLVCQKELTREAESALLSAKQKKELITNSMCKQPGNAKWHVPRKRPAKVLERHQKSTSVAIANC